MSEPSAENPSTYPSSWDALPGTETDAPSPEHSGAVEQEYYLQDREGAEPVKKGEHTRKELRSEGS